MSKPTTICSSALLLLICLSTALAQNQTGVAAKSPNVVITGSATGERLRFAAPSSIVQIRLEVYNSSGRKLFDNELRGGNVLDWLLRNGQAEPLPDGAYLCVLTVKSLAGRLTQAIGSVIVEKGSASLQKTDVSQMTSQQAEAVGPVEETAALTVLKEDEHPATTVIAHNGEEGQITRGKGALSFRIGDFFSGKDVEQMRLTSEGNLGIGIAHPTVKLEVDGLIRASQGIVFPDGTIQYSAASKTLGARSTTADQNPAGTPNERGSTAQSITGGHHKKRDVHPFTDGVFDVNASGGSYNINAARMGIGTPNPLVRLHVGAGAAPPVTAGATVLVEDGAATSMVMKSTFGAEMFFYQDNLNGTFGTASTHPLGIRTNNINRIWVTADGNVGIGTSAPVGKLDIVGNIAPNFGQTNIYAANGGQASLGFFNNNGASGWLIGRDLGGFGTNNFFIYDRANSTNRLFIDTNGNVGIGTTSTQSKLTVQTGATSYGLTHTDGAITVGSFVGGLGGPNPTPAGGWLGTKSNHPLYFFTNDSAPRMAIGTTGNVGIGTPSPVTRLEVVQPAATQLRFGAAGADNGGYLISTLPSQAIIAGGARWNGTNWIARDNVASLTATQFGHIEFYTDNGLNVGDTFSPSLRMKIDQNGNITQPVGKGGLPKAMVYVNGDGTVLRCYNGTTGASLTGGTTNIGCGITVTYSTSGSYRIDFPFPVADRFYTVTAQGGINAGANFEPTELSSRIFVYTFDTDQKTTKRDCPLMLVVY